MARFSRTDRQRIINEYLNITRRNVFVPAEFLDWLKDNPGHEVYDLFYGKSDEEAAHEYRLTLVRKFVNGTRIAVAYSTAPSDAKDVKVEVTEQTVKLPAFVSPMETRKDGGGYHATDVNDPATMQELARQAAADLRRVIQRHSGLATMLGIDLTALKDVADAFSAKAERKEAA
jgi:hypothetical protein